MKSSHLGKALTLTTALASIGASKTPVATLQAPEVEIQLALTKMRGIESELLGSNHVNSPVSIGSQDAARQRALVAAKDYFKASEHLSAIRELNTYLNLSQSPETAAFLEAQYMLGRSYEAIGLESRAMRSYMRYVAAFITHRKGRNNKLIDVLHRLMPLAATKGAASQRELRKLLSSVTSLSLPQEQKAEVYYYAANTASKAGSKKFASDWFAKASQDAKDPAIRVRSIYFNALIKLANNDYAAAKALLGKAAQIKGPGAREFRDLSRLALARIAISQRKTLEALKHYEEIAHDSPQYHNSVFELTYLHLNSGREKSARKLAKIYLKKFPQGKDAYKLKTLISYLDIRAGDLKNAAASIEDTDATLEALTKELQSTYGNKGKLTQDDINTIIAKAELKLTQSPTILKGQQVFAHLAEVKRRLADVRGNVRNMLYTLGRTNIEEFRPYWVARNQQLSRLSRESLLAGHKLVASYKFILRDVLNSVEKQDLAASQQRREALLSHPAKMLRQKNMWASWLNLVNLNNDIASQNKDMQKLQAQLATTRNLLRSTREQQSNPQTRDEDIKDLQRKIHKLRGHIGRSLEVLRAQRILDLINQSPHKAAMKLHTQYASSLHEEVTLLSHHFDATTDPSLRYLAEDALHAMKRWEANSRMVYSGLEGLDKDISSTLKGFIERVDQLQSVDQALATRINTVRDELEKLLGNAAGSMLAHYRAQAGVRKSKLNKWRADIEWLRFNNISDEKEKRTKRFELEQQVLKDNLRDLQEGVLWQWPE